MARVCLRVDAHAVRDDLMTIRCANLADRAITADPAWASRRQRHAHPMSRRSERAVHRWERRTAPVLTALAMVFRAAYAVPMEITTPSPRPGKRWRDPHGQRHRPDRFRHRIAGLLDRRTNRGRENTTHEAPKRTRPGTRRTRPAPTRGRAVTRVAPQPGGTAAWAAWAAVPDQRVILDRQVVDVVPDRDPALG